MTLSIAIERRAALRRFEDALKTEKRLMQMVQAVILPRWEQQPTLPLNRALQRFWPH